MYPSKEVVARRQRTIHLQTFGNPANPPASVLPGRQGEDFRRLLPLKDLSDCYFVVICDQRGAGLSERVPEEKLDLESFNEGTDEVRHAVAPGKSLTLSGHSYVGQLATQYAATHPGAVTQLVLIEPEPMNQNARGNYRSGIISFRDGQAIFWQNQVLTRRSMPRPSGDTFAPPCSLPSAPLLPVTPLPLADRLLQLGCRGLAPSG